MNPQQHTLATLLLDCGLIDADVLAVAQAEQLHSGLALGPQLLALGLVDETRLAHAMADFAGETEAAPSRLEPDPAAVALMPENMAREWQVCPVAWQAHVGVLLLALSTPKPLTALDRLRWQLAGVRALRVCYVAQSTLQSWQDACYPRQLQIDPLLAALDAGDTQGAANPVAQLVQQLLDHALHQRASDVHFEPEAAFVRIRYRVDGVMVPVRILHSRFWSPMLVRLKGLAGMDITETRRAQDGRFSLASGVDIRAASLPVVHGENLVLRLLERNRALLQLHELGLSEQALAALQALIRRPAGLILLTGPTGSGKTSTLYSILAHLNSSMVNIMTLEDPVEYKLAGVRQSAAGDSGLADFADGVRALLRQDPDIILIGEIRDTPTAQAAIRAAMTGHLVLATLHANSAAGALPRLLDLGISAALMADNLLGVIAQRLVRKLCVHCRKAIPAAELPQHPVALGEQPTVFAAVGCPRCDGRGYRGRLAIMEQLLLTPERVDLLLQPAHRRAALAQARQTGYRSLQDEVAACVAAGLTDLAEAQRVVDFTAAD
ncbi:type II secretory ATPase GspE/PulE/Tfp pilus assembly ATPase PilB-like protein [Silvimonas terrae]|uniref:Type II secretory ATPase GspE/PulE/Tfp pilus assembly ATPase PilB-like protein n=1 Tax=Silvimonas terrae TaxID=300266 RepID=A0A840RKK6_9NEIS|nr:GspE/PulE family protein [Silvimonas terrae]MBB5193114.1 type II secretory ATPase GspE/PulE/Tfp pilus assembly ATPase PilB-like protein [Silvimonas terrae]